MDELMALLHSPALFHVVFYFTVGVLGMFTHYLKKWAMGEITGSLWAYFFVDSGRRTILALLAFGSAASAELGTHLLDGMGLLAVALMAWKTGLICDTLNQGKTPAAGA